MSLILILTGYWLSRLAYQVIFTSKHQFAKGLSHSVIIYTLAYLYMKKKLEHQHENN